jgi:hypothetical protein
VTRRTVRLHRACSVPVDDGELRARDIGFAYEGVRAARRWNGVVRRGFSVSLDLGSGVFAASRSRLMVYWLFGIDL